MGAYLLYKLIDNGQSDEVNDWLEKQQEQQELDKFSMGLWFWSREDREIELKKVRETGNGCPDYAKIGEGKWKASGFCIEEEVCYGLVARLFKKLQEKFKVKIYRRSCALRNDYFTQEQISWITKNGEMLSS